MIPSAALAGLLMQDPLEAQNWAGRLPQAQENFMQTPVIGNSTDVVVNPMPVLRGRGHLAPGMQEYSDIPDWLPALNSPYGGWGGSYMQARRREQ